jgi:hypothetical protein
MRGKGKAGGFATRYVPGCATCSRGGKTVWRYHIQGGREGQHIRQGAQLPPQSTPVSSPFWIPSVQVAARGKSQGELGRRLMVSGRYLIKFDGTKLQLQMPNKFTSAIHTENSKDYSLHSPRPLTT